MTIENEDSFLEIYRDADDDRKRFIDALVKALLDGAEIEEVLKTCPDDLRDKVRKMLLH